MTSFDGYRCLPATQRRKSALPARRCQPHLSLIEEIWFGLNSHPRQVVSSLEGELLGDLTEALQRKGCLALFRSVIARFDGVHLS